MPYSINQHIEFMKKGDSHPLEDLAISAGYSNNYDGWKIIENARTRLCHELALSKEKGSVYKRLAAIDQFCDSIIPRIEEGYANGREHFGIPTNDEMHGMPPDNKLEYFKEYFEASWESTNTLWANKIPYFVSTKQGPRPFEHSMVAYILWDIKNANVKDIEPNLFIDGYNKDPLWEKNLDYGVSIAHDEKSGDPFDKGFAYSFRMNVLGENLIHGEDAIRYLMDLRDGKPSSLFPSLSKKDYEKLIEKERNRLEKHEEEKNKIGNYTPEEIKEMEREIRRLMPRILEIASWPMLMAESLEELIETGKPDLKKTHEYKELMKLDEHFAEISHIVDTYSFTEISRERLKRLEEIHSRF